MREKGFTLIELLVVISIIAILAGLLVPGLVKARTQAHKAKDMNNIKQIILALNLYAADNNQRYPNDATTSKNLVQLMDGNYIDDARVFGCPAKAEASWTSGSPGTLTNCHFVYNVGADSGGSPVQINTSYPSNFPLVADIADNFEPPEAGYVGYIGGQVEWVHVGAGNTFPDDIPTPAVPGLNSSQWVPQD